MGVHCKAKKSAPKTTAHQQSVIKARFKLLTQKSFSAKSIYICVIDDESNFPVDGNEWQSYYESATEDVKFPAKVLLWLAVTESGISEPVFFKASFVVNKEVYISKCLQYFINLSKNTTKQKKTVFWPVLPSAHYANDTLVRLEELKLNTSQRKKIHITSHRYSRSKKM
jgi:hypothetical protein